MTTRSSNRRWVAVLVPRHGAIEVYGMFNTADGARGEMDKRTRLQPNRYAGGKVTQVRQPMDRQAGRPSS
jgi:hypothetical protein